VTVFYYLEESCYTWMSRENHRCRNHYREWVQSC